MHSDNSSEGQVPLCRIKAMNMVLDVVGGFASARVVDMVVDRICHQLTTRDPEWLIWVKRNVDRWEDMCVVQGCEYERLTSHIMYMWQTAKSADAYYQRVSNSESTLKTHLGKSSGIVESLAHVPYGA